jgi:glycosyltransferase involved in cell wall biosynthesis
MRASFVIPTYNEEATLAQVLPVLLEVRLRR